MARHQHEGKGYYRLAGTAPPTDAKFVFNSALTVSVVSCKGGQSKTNQSDHAKVMSLFCLSISNAHVQI